MDLPRLLELNKHSIVDLMLCWHCGEMVQLTSYEQTEATSKNVGYLIASANFVIIGEDYHL